MGSKEQLLTGLWTLLNDFLYLHIDSLSFSLLRSFRSTFYGSNRCPPFLPHSLSRAPLHCRLCIGDGHGGDLQSQAPNQSLAILLSITNRCQFAQQREVLIAACHLQLLKVPHFIVAAHAVDVAFIVVTFIIIIAIVYLVICSKLGERTHATHK